MIGGINSILNWMSSWHPTDMYFDQYRNGGGGGGCSMQISHLQLLRKLFVYKWSSSLLDNWKTFQLPSEIHDREIARLAPLFSPDTLETVALQHFDASEARVKTFKADRRENTEGFKRDLLTYYVNKGHTRKVAGCIQDFCRRGYQHTHFSKFPKTAWN